MKNLKDLKKHIIRNIDPKWTTLEKVRYVYLESGKNLQKHTEFYLTIDDKLSNGLNARELDKVLLGRLKSEEWNKMLCKTGAEFIKEVLNYLGISSQLVETVGYTKIKGMKNHLHHYFLSVNIDGKNITPHKLRATYGTQLYEKTGDLYMVQECMGHSSPKTTELYIRGKKSEFAKTASEIMSKVIF